MMERQVSTELVRYLDIRNYNPEVGDIIIEHGWFKRTRWFGVVNYITENGVLQVICEGSMRLLVTTTPDAVESKTKLIRPSDIVNSWPGKYSIMQSDPKTNTPIWYI